MSLERLYLCRVPSQNGDEFATPPTFQSMNVKNIYIYIKINVLYTVNVSGLGCSEGGDYSTVY